MSNRNSTKTSDLKRKRSSSVTSSVTTTTSRNDGTFSSTKRTRFTNTNSVRTHHRQQKHSLKQVHTLSHECEVYSVDMRCTDDMSAAVLLAGLDNGIVCIHRTPLSPTKPMQWTLLKRFHAHTDRVNALHIHPTKPLFVSGSHDRTAKIWSLAGQLLIKCEFIGVTSLLVLIHLY